MIEYLILALHYLPCYSERIRRSIQRTHAGRMILRLFRWHLTPSLRMQTRHRFPDIINRYYAKRIIRPRRQHNAHEFNLFRLLFDAISGFKAAISGFEAAISGPDRK